MADQTMLCPDPESLSIQPLLNIRAPDSCVTVIARRGYGKSYLFSSWLYHQMKDTKRSFNQGNVIIFSSTGRLSNQFSFLSKENCRPFSEKTLVSVLKLQQRKKAMIISRADRRYKATGKRESVTFSPLIIGLDDVQSMTGRATDGTKGSFHSDAINFAMTCGRHLGVVLFQCIQSPKSLSSVVARSQTTHLCMAGLSAEQLKVCYTLTDGTVDFKTFSRMVASCGRHCFLLFDTTKPHGERFCYIKAPPFSQFQLRIKPHPSSKQSTKKKNNGKEEK